MQCFEICRTYGRRKMFNTRILALVLGVIFLQGIQRVIGRIGERCEHHWSCTDYRGETECHADGYCTCIYPELLYYTLMALAPRCDFVTLGQLQRGERCTQESCGESATCKPNGLCECHPGLIRVGDDCVRAQQVSPLDHCDDDGFDLERNGFVTYCDAMKNTYCLNEKCVCSDGYYLDFDTGRCKTKSSYLKEHGLTEYEGTVGMYCVFSSDCKSDLECDPFEDKCRCSAYCRYNEELDYCDCEDIGNGSTVGTLVGGLMVVFVIIGFVAYIAYRCTKKRQGEVHRSQPVPSSNTGQSYDVSLAYLPPPTAPSANTTLNPASSPLLSPSHRPMPAEGTPLPVETPRPQPYNPSFVQSSYPNESPPPYSTLFPYNSNSSSQEAYHPTNPSKDAKDSGM